MICVFEFDISGDFLFISNVEIIGTTVRGRSDTSDMKRNFLVLLDRMGNFAGFWPSEVLVQGREE